MSVRLWRCGLAEQRAYGASNGSGGQPGRATGAMRQQEPVRNVALPQSESRHGRTVAGVNSRNITTGAAENRPLQSSDTKTAGFHQACQLPARERHLERAACPSYEVPG